MPMQGRNTEQSSRLTLREYEQRRVTRNRAFGVTILVLLVLGGGFHLLRTQPVKDILAVADTPLSVSHAAPLAPVRQAVPPLSRRTGNTAALPSSPTIQPSGVRRIAVPIAGSSPELLPDEPTVPSKTIAARPPRRHRKRHSPPTSAENKTAPNIQLEKQPQPPEQSESKPAENTGTPPDDVPTP